MENFRYFMPTKIYFGKDIIKTKCDEFKRFEGAAYIITGKYSSKQNGSLKDVIDSLNSINKPYIIFDEVEENPSLETIEKAVKLGVENNVGFIIGIGGGSPLDAAKAIGVFISNPAYNRDNIFTAPKLKSLPILAVPTTSGTGSEVTPYSIVTDNKIKTKRNLGQVVFPEIAFLDPKYTYNMPYEVTVNTAIDAFSHLAEGYLNNKASILSDGEAERGIELFGACIENLLDRNITEEIREKLMIVSSLGGIVISQAGTSLPHGMGYPLTYFKGIPHGRANGILFKEYLKIFKNKEKVDKMLKLMGLNSINDFGDVIQRLLGKTDIVITEQEIKSYSEDMINNKGKLKNHPESVSFEQIYDIYKNSLLG